MRISDWSSDVCSSDLVMMGARSRVPLVRGHLGSALYGECVLFGRETVEIRAHDARRWQGIFGIREYPALTRPGQINALLGQEFAFVVPQTRLEERPGGKECVCTWRSGWLPNH